MQTLVTGAAGFIGAAVSGIDNLSDYYDVSLKKARLERLVGPNSFGIGPPHRG